MSIPSAVAILSSVISLRFHVGDGMPCARCLEHLKRSLPSGEDLIRALRFGTLDFVVRLLAADFLFVCLWPALLTA